METAASNANSYMPPGIANATIRLAIIKAKKSPLIDYMQKNIKETVNVKEIRSRLAKISASMAREIAENRAERL